MAKKEGSGNVGEYFERLAVYLIFAVCGVLSIVVWVFNWICWNYHCCCFDRFHETANKVFTWWLSWVFLCGVLACCIAGFVTANRFGFSLNAAQCAYERIYYDLMYGQMKKTYPKWEGFNEIKTAYKNLNYIFRRIQAFDFYMMIFNSTTEVMSFYKDPSVNISEEVIINVSSYFDYPVPKDFVDDIFILYLIGSIKPEEMKTSMKLINANLFPTMNDFLQLRKNWYNIKTNVNMYSPVISLIQSLSEWDNVFIPYKTKFMEYYDYYVDVFMAMGKIVPLVYFSLLLTFVVASGALLITYYCHQYSENQQWWILPMHIAWNGLRFFIFSFFIYGCAFGMLFLGARDFIGYLQFAFSRENIFSENMVILPEKTQPIFQYCLFSNTTDVFDKYYTSMNDFVKYAVKIQSIRENIREFPKGAHINLQLYYDDVVDILEDCYLDFAINSTIKSAVEYFKPIINRGDTIYENLDCSFVNNTINLMYRAIWDFSWETRILCALSCCIGFFGAIAVYSFLWVMELWNKDGGYYNNNYYNRYNNNNNYINNNNNNVIQPNKTQKRKIKKMKVPPPQDLDDESHTELANCKNEEDNISN